MSADLDALVALMPFAGQLGLALDEAGADRVVARLDWAPHLCTTAGVLHGGVLMSLADSAGALVTFLGLPEGKTTATITSTSHMFRPVTGGTVRAVAVPVQWCCSCWPATPPTASRVNAFSRPASRFFPSARRCC